MNNKAISYTKLASIIMMVLILIADCFGWVITKYLCYFIAAKFGAFDVAFTTVVFYLCTIAAMVIVGSVYKLADNMQKGIVFEKVNPKLMGYITYALIAIAILCAAGAWVWIGEAFLTVIALFMALIVLCVKVAFDRAIAMKNDLDLTI